MQVMQTSVLIKYRPLFAFLKRQAAPVAHELQRSYVGAARVYYETGFRRYARSLGVIKVIRRSRLKSLLVLIFLGTYNGTIRFNSSGVRKVGRYPTRY